MELLFKVYSEFLGTVIRAITGQLYTQDQIKRITSGATGKYLKEFFPKTRDGEGTLQRVESARIHIEAAGTIIRDMQEDLAVQDKQLSELVKSVKEKKRLADRYQTLADTNKEAFEAFRIEMENALRKELTEQARKGKRIRQVISFLLWLVTLILGAALGTYFKEIVTWLSST
ncbi:hypothetical protein [Kangiella spongicola]|uniref:Uncharacterized protein n=1 Tax=Kangiella spongicola TaxID=796379 RepID=A0A318D3U8_9GAMM|nr:hypothetical protein [Kangiella spongicola]PXF63992.1 hypothetical protein DL796_02290 [Kangiella spongicola]